MRLKIATNINTMVVSCATFENPAFYCLGVESQHSFFAICHLTHLFQNTTGTNTPLPHII